MVRFSALPYLRTHGVTSVGIGYKRTGSRLTEEIAVQFTVARLLSDRELKRKTTPAVRIPDSFILPDGRRINTDVIERAYRRTHSDPADVALPSDDPVANVRRTRLDPVRPGASVGIQETGAGTITAIVFAADGTPFALSNFHVLAGANSDIDDPVAQPGPLDDSDEVANRLGKLVRRHLSRAGDGAICSIENRGFDRSILGLNVVPNQVAVGALNDPVVKSGRSTGITHGVVVRSNVIATVAYPQGDREVGGFEIGASSVNPPGPRGISDAGDSGSLWLIDPQPGAADDIAVGIQVSEAQHPDEAKEIALACDLHSILDKLSVSLFPVQ